MVAPSLVGPVIGPGGLGWHCGQVGVIMASLQAAKSDFQAWAATDSV